MLIKENLRNKSRLQIFIMFPRKNAWLIDIVTLTAMSQELVTGMQAVEDNPPWKHQHLGRNLTLIEIKEQGILLNFNELSLGVWQKIFIHKGNQRHFICKPNPLIHTILLWTTPSNIVKRSAKRLSSKVNNCRIQDNLQIQIVPYHEPISEILQDLLTAIWNSLRNVSLRVIWPHHLCNQKRVYVLVPIFFPMLFPTQPFG